MGEEEKLIPEENLYIYDDINNLSYTIMGKIDLNQPDKEFLLKGYSGLGGEVYVSKDNIYVATFDSYANYETNLLGWAKVSKVSASNQNNKVSTLLSKSRGKGGRIGIVWTNMRAF